MINEEKFLSDLRDMLKADEEIDMDNDGAKHDALLVWRILQLRRKPR